MSPSRPRASACCSPSRLPTQTVPGLLACRALSEPGEYRQLRFTRPPGAVEILLVRHGESEPAREGEPFPLTDGQGDPELAPVGQAQAEMVAARLANEDVAAIYVSTLRRQAQTAAPLPPGLWL